MKHSKFTLIELLVVISIIAVLASLLLPVLGRGRSQARHASCKNNLKQIPLATEMYTDDNDQYYHGTAVGSHSWDDIISNYMGRPMSADQKDQSPLDSAEGINNKILGCPADQRSFDDADKRSYSMNEGGTNWGGNFTGIARLEKSVRTTDVSSLSDTVLFGERFNNGNKVGKSNSAGLANYFGKYLENLSGVHLKGANYFTVVFCDGHVEYLHAALIDPDKMDR